MTEQNKTEWKKEISAGGVVYKIEGDKTFVLLIKPKRPNFGPPEGYWAFPKGRLDANEDKQQAAIREVREEAGVNAEIELELGMVKYFRKSKHYGDALKFVHYFLMKYIDGDPNDHDEETAEAKWFLLDEVMSNLKFPSDKETFEKALTHLQAVGEAV